MAAIDWTNVTGHAPRLSSVPVDAQTDILAYVNGALDVDVLGGEESAAVKLARVYLAAHFGSVELAEGGRGRGPVVSESSGRQARSYGPATASQLEQTADGRMYLQVIRTSPARVGWKV